MQDNLCLLYKTLKSDGLPLSALAGTMQPLREAPVAFFQDMCLNIHKLNYYFFGEVEVVHFDIYLHTIMTYEFQKNLII